jgi:DNA-binding XRE family transcriptional regulator
VASISSPWGYSPHNAWTRSAKEIKSVDRYRAKTYLLTCSSSDGRLCSICVTKLLWEIKLPRKPIFAQYLRDARIKRRLSVAEVAQEVGVSQASIYLWERDLCRPRDANLTALCKVLKLPVRATRELAAA